MEGDLNLHTAGLLDQYILYMWYTSSIHYGDHKVIKGIKKKCMKGGHVYHTEHRCYCPHAHTLLWVGVHAFIKLWFLQSAGSLAEPKCTFHHAPH
jgi:hypothetical protein